MNIQQISTAEAALQKGCEGTVYQNSANPALLYVKGAPGTTLSQNSIDATALTALVSGDVIVNNRDGLGRATSYTQGGVTYTVTYGNFGIATVSGGGTVQTYNYDASGLLTSVTTA